LRFTAVDSGFLPGGRVLTCIPQVINQFISR
jgi:hypothetical protein